MNQFKIISPAPGGTYTEALASLFEKLRNHFAAEAAAGRQPVFVRFFVSDAQNQAAALQDALSRAPWAGSTAISIVEQPPLDHSHAVALVQTAPEAPACLFHSLRLTEEEAGTYVSGELQVEHTDLAFIPLTQQTEVLCYEFKATKDDTFYIVYINALTGEEEQIFQVINSAEGDLVV